MAGGKDTSADLMITLAGGINAMSSISGFKPVSNEAVVRAAPDVILTMARGGHAITADKVFKQPALKLTPAAKGKRLMSMDGLYLLGMGPRTPDAALELIGKLYPDQMPHAHRQE